MLVSIMLSGNLPSSYISNSKVRTAHTPSDRHRSPHTHHFLCRPTYAPLPVISRPYTSATCPTNHPRSGKVDPSEPSGLLQKVCPCGDQPHPCHSLIVPPNERPNVIRDGVETGRGLFRVAPVETKQSRSAAGRAARRSLCTVRSAHW
jgi:hypothetical protein